MSRWTTDAVLAEFHRWVWAPADATIARTARLRLSVRRDEATVLDGAVLDAAPEGVAADELVAEARDLAAGHGATTLLWTVWPRPSPPDLAEALRRAGGVVTEPFDVCSYDLTSGPLDLTVPPDIDAHAATTAEDVWAAHRVRSTLWPEFDLPSQADVDREVASGGGRYVAYYAGRAVGCAGHELAGEVIRLWGGGVLPSFRGKGAYRGLVAARLSDAAEQGGSLAIVHARWGTSAPILRRMGFTVHGISQVYRVPVVE
ncbi:GNAT family N-acetyltransferase [Flindersiella endophytica]